VPKAAEWGYLLLIGLMHFRFRRKEKLKAQQKATLEEQELQVV
jgi:hypothetical protein